MSSAFDQLYAAVALPSLKAKLGQTITHNPAGVVADAELITGAIVDFDAQADLQGPRITDQNGRRMVLHARVKIPASVTVTYGPRADQASTFVIDIGDGHGSSTWWALRRDGQDHSLQTLGLVRVLKGTTKETRE